MDRRLPSTRHHLPTRPPCDPVSFETYHLCITTSPTSRQTPPRCSSCLPHKEADPHPSRVGHHPTTLPTPRSSLLQRSSTALSRTTYLGPRYQFETWGPYRAPRKNLFPHGSGTRRTKEIHH